MATRTETAFQEKRETLETSHAEHLNTQKDRDRSVLSIYLTAAARAGTVSFNDYEDAEYTLSAYDTVRVHGLFHDELMLQTKYGLPSDYGKIMYKHVGLPTPVNLLRSKTTFNIKGCLLGELSEGHHGLNNRPKGPLMEVNPHYVTPMFRCEYDEETEKAFCKRCGLSVDVIAIYKELWPEGKARIEEQSMAAMCLYDRHAKRGCSVEPDLIILPTNQILDRTMQLWDRHTEEMAFPDSTDDEDDQQRDDDWDGDALRENWE